MATDELARRPLGYWDCGQAGRQGLQGQEAEDKQAVGSAAGAVKSQWP